MNCSGDDIFVYKNYRPMYCLNCGQALDWSDNGIFRIEKKTFVCRYGKDYGI